MLLHVLLRLISPVRGVSYSRCICPGCCGVRPSCTCTLGAPVAEALEQFFISALLTSARRKSAEIAPVQPVTAQQIYFTSSQASEKGLSSVVRSSKPMPVANCVFFQDLQRRPLPCVHLTLNIHSLVLLLRRHNLSLNCPIWVLSLLTPSHLTALCTALPWMKNSAMQGKEAVSLLDLLEGSWKDLEAFISSVFFHQDKLNSA